ncbi:50S ribosomal protein L7/L12 [Nitzschia inconspicua]|uniref:50S ribosomal protein L7/L12 n=1 Tax=Nitzschia inconspicua TaxID=303405 RepID=A0A9K3PRV8_9STRA|nr:50S ribosomal protein L7/L12 [Nitzschia inconspicua]
MTSTATTRLLVQVQRRAISHSHWCMSTRTVAFTAQSHRRESPISAFRVRQNILSMPAERYSSDASAPDAVAEPTSLSSPKLQSLYDTIVGLPEKDVNILGALVIQILGRKIFPGQFGGAAAGGMTVGNGPDGREDAPEEAQAKTVFDLKLVGFDAKAKIKVIKEVRAIAGLGLKEAKELVESAPKTIQKDLKQEKAEEIKAQLEAVGAEVELV